MTPDDAVVLADFLDRRAADRLQARLLGERIGAEVWEASQAAPLLDGGAPPIGPTVVVRRADHAGALVLAQLFGEVDAGSSRVAPPPRDLWHGAAHHRLLAVGLTLVLLFAVVVLALAAAQV